MGGVLFALVWLASCREEMPDKPTVEPSAGVYITNEGTYNFNTASLGWYDIEKEVYWGYRYEQAHARSLGDVLQSLLITADNLWLVLNNSNKIVVLSRDSLQEIAVVEGVESPRYLVAVNDDVLWASSLTSGKIYVIDRKAMQVDHSFDFPPGWSEQMLMDGGLVWVSHPAWYSGPTSRYVYVVDPVGETIVDSIQVLDGPSLMLQGPAHTAWVYCQGHEQSGAPGGVVRLSLEEKKILDQVTFPANAYPLGSGISYDSSRNRLYYLRGDVLAVPADNLSQGAQEQLVASNGKNYYSLKYIAATDEIWVGDAVDFVQSGVVERYSAQGEQKGHFRAGVIPNGYYYVER